MAGFSRVVTSIWERAQRTKPHTPGTALFTAMMRFLRVKVNTTVTTYNPTAIWDDPNSKWDETIWDLEEER